MRNDRQAERRFFAPNTESIGSARIRRGTTGQVTDQNQVPPVGRDSPAPRWIKMIRWKRLATNVPDFVAETDEFAFTACVEDPHVQVHG